ncbi:proprotein convertase P-domain-containing protein [Tahibacter harae]|uniref:Proprotein convertase P-domain-containing protein n=1 Tax=Tahibacter harae TaxID=2963937 RepID=A0ABT1QYG2_9GAMM|nr:proprotein convertase P-domain-containing protein [Tahibacter harae]MCQ4167306.1 proprotein convertase P-domain-containing protein [Tahibacter harae]
MNASTQHHRRWGAALWRAALPACLFLALTAGAGNAAEPPQARASTISIQLDNYRGKADSLAQVNLFTPATSRSASADPVTQLAVSSGTLLELDTGAIAALQKAQPSSITLALPTRERGTVELELFAHDIFAPDFKITASGGEDTSKISRGLHYRGIVKGEPSSFAAVSVFDSEIIGTFSTATEGNWVIGKLEGLNRSNRHIIYAESALLDKSGAPGCAMDLKGGPRGSLAKFWDDPAEEAAAAEAPAVAAASAGAGSKASDELQTVKCATEWMEAEYDIFQNRGSLQAATDYVTAVFNNSSTLYANDGITLKLQQAYIWTSADPYNGSSSTSNLSSFQSNRASSFTGTIAQLLTFRSLGGGVAAGFSGICNASRSASMCTSGVQSSYNTVPTYSWTVSVVTHEAGHLLGSRHTHACVWNGNNTAIDGCSGATEGGCPLPGNPSGGGTIMSYCHLTNVGINFNRGFGSQPATTIRNRVEGGSCLGNCEGGGGGGALTRGVALTGQSAATNTSLAYTLAVPAGATNLTFTTSGGSGDADMFVRFGSAPTTTTYDCKSEGSTNAETCTIAAPSAGTYHVMLRAYAAFSGLSIVGNYSTGGGGTQTYSNTTDVAISDNATVESPITVSGRSGNAPSNAQVAVNIVHTYQGDLKVDLVAPDGSVYVLHNRAGGGTDNIVQTYTVNLSSEPLNGTWRLRVNDNGPGDVGKIDSWSITF